MTETKRIRWEPTKYGGWAGHVGTARDFLFQVWLADTEAGGWQLDSTLPGQFGSGWHRCDTDPDKLKAEAERWLQEFVSSLGAVFAETLLTPLIARHAMIPSEWGGGMCGTCWVKGGSRAAWPCEEILAIAALLPTEAPAPMAGEAAEIDQVAASPAAGDKETTDG